MPHTQTQAAPYTTIFRSLGPAFALLLLAFATFFPALHAGFIWDDDTTLLANIVTQPNALVRTWFSTSQPNYWPVTWTGLWLQWQTWGAQPFGYHLVNLILHAACAIALWRLLLRLRVAGAWLAAALFVVHPVNVETAAWVTQQKTLLSVLFGACSMWAYFAHRARARPHLFLLSICAYALSLLSKSATVCLPVVLLMIEWWQHQRLDRSHIIRALPFFLLALAAGVTEIWFQYNRALAGEVRADPLLTRALVATHAAAFYLRHVLWPAGGCFIHPTPQIQPQMLSAWLTPVAWLLAAGALWRQRADWGRHAALALGAYLAMLLPVLGFLNIYFMQYAWVADHWQYPAIIAPLAGIAALLHVLCRSSRAPAPAPLPNRQAEPTTGSPPLVHTHPLLFHAVGTALVLLLALVSLQRLPAYQNAEALWRDTIARNPKAWMAYSNWGTLCVQQGKYAEAEAHLLQAITLRPAAYQQRLTLAMALERQGRVDEARRCLDQTLTIAPNNVYTLYELGRLHMSTGAVELARAAFTQAADRASNYAPPRVGLALIALQNGDAALAASFIQNALAIDPRHAEALHIAGNLFFDRRQFAQARHYYERARAIDPLRRGIDADLGVVCALTGDYAAAIACFRAALARDPNDADVRQNLERALRDQAAATSPAAP